MDSGKESKFLQLTGDGVNENSNKLDAQTRDASTVLTAQEKPGVSQSSSEKFYICQSRPGPFEIHVLPIIDKHKTSASTRIFDTIEQPKSTENTRDGNETVSPVTACFKSIVIADAPEHAPVTPAILDTSILRDDSAIASQGAHYRHVFRRLGSHRPPPTTPPEPLSPDQLSMPTLPSLHFASTPASIEQYREERRLNPIGFDQRTMEIKNVLVQAKVDRGGTDVLLNNEYTAELASRLDAEAIERWSVIRTHDEEEYIESEDEDIELAHPSQVIKSGVGDTEAVKEDTMHYEKGVETDTKDKEREREKGKKLRVEVDNRDEITLDDIINSLIRLRNENNDKVSDNLLDGLHWLKKRTDDSRAAFF